MHELLWPMKGFRRKSQSIIVTSSDTPCRRDQNRIRILLFFYASIPRLYASSHNVPNRFMSRPINIRSSPPIQEELTLTLFRFFLSTIDGLPSGEQLLPSDAFIQVLTWKQPNVRPRSSIVIFCILFLPLHDCSKFMFLTPPSVSQN